jgi:hypothetical protein
MAEDKEYLDQYDDGNPDIGWDGERALTDEQIKELASLVGFVLFEFNALETNLDWIIAEAINERSHQPGYAITAEMNAVFTKKVLVFKALYGPLVKYSENEELMESFEALCKNLFKLKDVRNKVAHADWLKATNKYEVRLKIATDEGGPYAIRKIMPPEFLAAKIDELEACNENIERFSELSNSVLAAYGRLPE